MASLIDHVYITVSNINRALPFYDRLLKPMGITRSVFNEGKNGLQGHPDIYGYGRGRRLFLWLKVGEVRAPSHVGFAAKSKEEVDAAYKEAIAEGGRPDVVFGGAPGPRKHYDDRYYAANILDADGNEIEITYKSFQHPSPGTD
ncbi:hypothetical protein CSOJ01_07858 [Colletotrichum sojae]|uniref:VOC domain-containing protein n=1 Tax=Colletotrichum sojae TaxID=2175907 RepID=A0A8H6J7U9_9PEZI|nr:hypothetical protein CSOJ01_07858 [Colletotrichum sojae]